MTSSEVRSSRKKRYTLVLPEDLFDEVQKVADQKGSTLVEVLRQFIKLGLLAAEIEKSPDSALLIREGRSIQQIRLL